MKDAQTRTTVGLESGLFRRLKEIADRQHRKVDDLVAESVKARFRIHDVEERIAAVAEIASMDLPVGEWEELENDIIEGATE
jgi:predicted DNA-binding ribbon-helix-helix protein